MPAKLSVNVNAIAMLRNRRDLPWPSVTHLGRIALLAGAQGLTVHPRPDQRHVRFTDLPEIRALIDREFQGCEFNIEGFPAEDFLRLVENNRPEQVTLVPDDPSQATSDHGWDFSTSRSVLENVVGRLKKAGCRVSLFVNPAPDREGLTIAREVGADRVELYTGPYGALYADPEGQERMAGLLAETADIALSLGLEINAGHDLTVANLPALVRHIPHLAEVSIGHALTAEALEFGMAEAVRRFRRACGQHV